MRLQAGLDFTSCGEGDKQKLCKDCSQEQKDKCEIKESKKLKAQPSKK